MDDVDFTRQNRTYETGRLKDIASHIREDIILMLAESKSGHAGGSLSCADILTAIYFAKMRHDPKNPKWPDRDRFLLSKGHAAPALYATLAECGYFPKEELKTLRKINSRLQGHGDPNKLPGVEIPGGPEGIGLSEGIGMALGARLDNRPIRIYVLMGDGELDEGEIWEASMSAVKFGLDNIVAIIDKNGLQQEGKTSDIMPTESVSSKFKSFNWNVIEVNGNDIEQVLNALNESEKNKGAPTVIVANTIKGKGVDFMENKVEYHAKIITPDVAEQALNQIHNAK